MLSNGRTASVQDANLFSFGLPFALSRLLQSRFRFGEILAEVCPVEADVVIAVPDSGVVSAIGYGAKAGIPFQQGLIRSHYVGRTFIEPSQKIRDFGVRLKLAPVRPILEVSASSNPKPPTPELAPFPFHAPRSPRGEQRDQGLCMNPGEWWKERYATLMAMHRGLVLGPSMSKKNVRELHLFGGVGKEAGAAASTSLT